MSDKSFARFVVYTALVLGALYAPFAHQDWIQGVCKEVHPDSTKDAINCWWNIQYPNSGDIIE